MEIHLLASGSKGNACLVCDGDAHVLIDCGTTKKYLSQSLHKYGLDFEHLDALVITHDHGDHISQVKHFSNIPVYSPVVIDGIDHFHVQAQKSFMVESLRFTPIALSHDAPFTMGYIIENGLEKLVYITDTGYVNQQYFSLIQNADYYVFEANHDIEMLMATNRPHYLKARIYGDSGHMNNEDSGQVLAKIIGDKTKMIILAHISEQANTQQMALQSVVTILKQQQVVNHDLWIIASGQYGDVGKGGQDEEMDRGNCYYHFSVE